jgi:hypothetical protein
MPQDTTQDRDPIEEYWATYSRPVQPLLPLDWPVEQDGWTSGRYAFAALVWGLIFMLLISLEAGI